MLKVQWIVNLFGHVTKSCEIRMTFKEKKGIYQLYSPGNFLTFLTIISIRLRK